jgi:hypothetical protein
MLKRLASSLSGRKPRANAEDQACTGFDKGASVYRRLDRPSLWVAFFAAVSAIALPALSQAQDLPKTTLFLADYKLGVAGAYQYQGNTLYFEARTPDGSTEMSARLLDARGTTIAISGHSMDDVWLEYTGFEAASATKSLSLASALPNALSSELDGQLFAAEISELSKLALGAVRGFAATATVVVDSATANLPSRSVTALEAANNGDLAAATQLMVTVSTPDSLSVKLGGVTIEALIQYFPDGENEENPAVAGRTEVSAQILSSSGKSLIQQIGGDDIPNGWESSTTGMFRPGSREPIDPIEASVEAGSAIRASALMARFPSIATSEETDAVSTLTAILRDDGLFPNPAITPDATYSSTCGNCFKSSVQVWHKGLVGVAQHSGSVVLHYNDNNPSRFPVLEYATTYCNHGTCPGKKPMVHPCTYNGPWLASYRYAPHYKITAPPPNPVSGYHSCHKTSYHLYSGAFWPVIHGHNCNDDTWTQVRAIRGESYDINPSDNPFSNGARCDNHGFTDPRSPGCNE